MDNNQNQTLPLQPQDQKVNPETPEVILIHPQTQIPEELLQQIPPSPKI